ncbi:hypothetical protein MGI_01316 [Candida albicans P75016]|nr:hypothetical protein MGI_01316 [Candida albicans P75016]
MLIKGVKYACERCIRGHRVTTCTHSNEPLTMIKPKGRPVTQCQHCRENRKSKNLHVTCSCGKKGKNGSHLPSCACHKTNHCTCSTNMTKKTTTKGDIHHMTASEKAKKKSLIDAANAGLKKRSDSVSTTQSAASSSASPSSATSPNKKSSVPPPGPTNSQQKKQQSTSPNQSRQTTQPAYNNLSDQNFVIEDIVFPFSTDNGLFDMFSSNTTSEVGGAGSGNKDSQIATSNLASDNSTPFNSNYDTGISYSNKDVGLPLSPNETEADPMFPLFPLVGTQSFDRENQPLSALSNEKEPPQPQQPTPVRPSHNVSTAMNNISSNSYSSIPSAVEVSSINHQQSRPKRPESVLSIASNSSTRSFDFFGNNHTNYNSSFMNGSLPTSSTSAAFPPSNGFDENSLSNLNPDDHNNMQHHFGRTGLGAVKFGSQLSKIESEMYTDNFFDDPYAPQSQNVDQLQFPDTTTTIPNLYNVTEFNPSDNYASSNPSNYDVNNNSDVITNGGNNHRNNNNNNDTIYPSYSNENKITINDNSININGNTVGNENHPNITSTSSVQLPGNSEIPNLYNVQDILSDSAFDDFIPTLTDNTKDQSNI